MQQVDTAIDILERLVGFATVSRDSNLDLIHWVADYLRHYGVEPTIIHDADAPKASLFATIGEAAAPGILLSGHSDVVPVDGQQWSSDPFVLRREGGRLYGRGTCDMKGFIALFLAFVPQWSKQSLARPVHLAISYDEEVGCSGVHGLLAHVSGLPVAPQLCLVGEPTSMQVVSAHKGIFVVETRVRGLAGHSSNPAAGANAISFMARFIALLEAEGASVAAAPTDDAFDPPHTTLNLGTLTAGAAVNIIAEEATLHWEMRPLPGVDMAEVLDRVMARAAADILPDLRGRAGAAARLESRIVANAPALARGDNAPAEEVIMRLLGANAWTTAAFTTEAGLFQGTAGVPTVVCGPGSIEQAHKPDEFVSIEQLERCADLLNRLVV